MVSVCLAVKNGEAYLQEQIDSILPQLRPNDELVISDDHSTDDTLSIIDSYNDQRLRVVSFGGSGLASNFENCLRHAWGDYLFLADQDDVWLPRKVDVLMDHLSRFDLVVCNCSLTDSQLRVMHDSFFDLHKSGPGLVKNLFRNTYMGCCMAFHRNVLTKALPVPAGLPVHDLWLGLTAEMFFKTTFVDEVLVLHRRHSENASTTGRKSTTPISNRIHYRYQILNRLLQLKYA